jgi:hypothetical protein
MRIYNNKLNHMSHIGDYMHIHDASLMLPIDGGLANAESNQLMVKDG